MNAKNINVIGAHQYNWQHMVFVTKYRSKMFKNPKTVKIIRGALYSVAERYKLTIKEISFGEDYAHVYLEVSVSNTIPISYVVQQVLDPETETHYRTTSENGTFHHRYIL